jgi:hypothetical protein
LVKAKRILGFLCLALLQGCSVTRIAYDHADSYLRWQANGYFAFQGEQSLELDQRIAALLAWNRATALPQYARLAEDASARARRGIRREDLEWAYDAVKKQVGETLGAAAAESAGLLDRLSPGQIARFEMRLAEENRKFAKEQMQGTVEQRHKRRVKLNVERLEQWFGTLNEAQVERVRRYSARAPFSAELRDRDRKRRQGELLAMLRAREAKQHLAQWAQAWDRGREPAYANAARETEAEYFDLLLDMDRLLTPAQRETCAAHLQKYAALFDSLSRR